MSDSLITIIAIFLAAILMFIFPLMTMSERTDDISQLAVKTATAEFADRVRTTGKLTLDDYDKYIATLAATGNTYDIEMQIQHIDENPGVKVTQAEVQKIGENLYYNEYTTQIEERLNDKKSKGRVVLKEGDMFFVTVKNTNKTISEVLRGFLYSISGNDSYQISARHGGIVSVNGSN